MIDFVVVQIPSHLYTYSWDPKTDWSHYFAYGAEIQRYFESFADRHGSRKYMKLSTKVIECRWNEAAGTWNLVLEDQRTGATWTDWAHCLINGTGILNTWKWPDIKGFADYAGPKVHSAAWDHSVDFEGKSVCVIGAGSSAIQIVPELQRKARELTTFIRSPTWISPPFGASVLEEDLRKGKGGGDPGLRQYTFSKKKKTTNLHTPLKTESGSP